MAQLYRSAASIIYAGPTTGKSTLLKTLENQEIGCFDVDTIVNVSIPGYWDVLRRVAEQPLVKEFVNQVVADLLHRSTYEQHYLPVISSVWNPQFVSRFHAPGAQPPLLVVRPNPVRVHGLSKAKGHPGIPVELAEKWILKVQAYARLQFQHVLWLPDDLFLTDVVCYRGNQWQLTALGRQLLLDQEASERSDLSIAASHEPSLLAKDVPVVAEQGFSEEVTPIGEGPSERDQASNSNDSSTADSSIIEKTRKFLSGAASALLGNGEGGKNEN